MTSTSCDGSPLHERSPRPLPLHDAVLVLQKAYREDGTSNAGSLTMRSDTFAGSGPAPRGGQ
jgi:hypothetical protein